MSTVNDFKIGDWVLTDLGNEGRVDNLDDKYVYVTLGDGEYAYWNPDELTHVTPTESNNLFLIGELLTATKRNKKAFELVLKLAANMGFDLDDI